MAKIKELYIEQYKGKVYNLQVKKNRTFVINGFVTHNCPYCRKFHLSDDGVTPRLYTLSNLLMNGNNIGKKQRDWNAVVTSTHPHCRCQLSQLPTGWYFSKEGPLEFIGEKNAQERIDENMTEL